MAEDYQFDDLDSTTDSGTAGDASTDDGTVAAGGDTTADAPAADAAADAPAAADTGSSAGGTTGGTTGGGSGNGYASELFSKQIKAKFRTFFIDLKESSNGKFIKISEKSHGRKSTIMMDAEDVPVFIEALQEVAEKL